MVKVTVVQRLLEHYLDLLEGSGDAPALLRKWGIGFGEEVGSVQEVLERFKGSGDEGVER